MCLTKSLICPTSSIKGFFHNPLNVLNLSYRVRLNFDLVRHMEKTSRKPGRPKTVNDSTSSPWTIRGVSHETREAVKKASRKEGLPIGDWVDRNLLSASHSVLGTGDTQKEVGPTTEDMMLTFVKDWTEKQEKQSDLMEALSTEIKSLKEEKSKSWFQRLTS
jgi:hypothetical protein